MVSEARATEGTEFLHQYLDLTELHMGPTLQAMVITISFHLSQLVGTETIFKVLLKVQKSQKTISIGTRRLQQSQGHSTEESKTVLQVSSIFQNLKVFFHAHYLRQGATVMGKYRNILQSVEI